MKRRREAASAIPGLSADMVDLLLTGDAPGDPFLYFDFEPEQLDALRRIHRDALAQEARRRGLAPKEPEHGRS